ncbi:MFS transporter [Roseovarius salis]|uniref:MFS transporter n=1 Tax=Roseovarius salis TaxID=3376063 RepID=UPI0037CC2218
MPETGRNSDRSNDQRARPEAGGDSPQQPIRQTGLHGMHLGLVIALFALAYFFSLFFRTVNAVLSPRLESELGLGPGNLGLLTAAYFLGTAASQIPIGICLDRYGPRRVQTVLLCVAAAGIATFGLAEAVPLLVFARFVIGIGVAGCLVACYQAASLWLRPRNLPLASGLFLAVGGIGALAATQPVSVIIRLTDWRTMFLALAAIVLLNALAIWRAAPEPRARPSISWQSWRSGFHTVLRNDRLRRYLPIAAVCFGTGTSMQGLWAAPWMRDIAGLQASAVTWSLTAMAVALTVGSAAGGIVGSALGRFGITFPQLILGSACLFICAELGLVLFPGHFDLISWLLIALTYNPVTLAYAYVALSQDRAFIGLSNALMNTGVILATFLIQYVLGAIFSVTNAGVTQWPYLLSMAGLIVLQVAALAWCLGAPNREE